MEQLKPSCDPVGGEGSTGEMHQVSAQRCQWESCTQKDIYPVLNEIFWRIRLFRGCASTLQVRYWRSETSQMSLKKDWK
jgi:hypothetical protein